MAEQSYYVGFDMGGTKMLAAVLDSGFTELQSAKTRTPIGAGNEEMLDAIVSLVEEVVSSAKLKMREIRVIGIAVPGPIDREQGLVIDLPNAGMHDYRLREKLMERLGVDVVLENDVNAGTYGEFVGGAAIGKRNVIGVFPGTGIGGGIIIDGFLYRGRSGRAGEIGHMIVEAGGRRCGCGKYGCLEAVCSRTAIAKDLVHLAQNGQAPTVLEKAGTDIAEVKSGVIKKAMAEGERAVIEVVERAAWYLGIGLGSCIDIFDPDVVVIGGGLVEKLGRAYLDPVEKSMRAHTMASPDTPLVAATLGDDSVVIGAAALAAREFA